MKFDRYTRTEIAEGEAKIKTVLSAFKDNGLTGQPPFGARMDDNWQYLGPHNYQAFIVTARNGGWVADLLLRTVPQGLPDIMGTPEGFPYPTYEQAFEAGLRIVAEFLAQAQTPSRLHS